MNEHNIKGRINDAVQKATKEYQAQPDVKTEFGRPILGYAAVANPLFDMYFRKQLCTHPKELFRPGNTIIVHFIPFSKEVVESNRGGSKPSLEWEQAKSESMWLSMKLNRVIRATLDEVGRLSSHLNTPADWDEELCREDWSHKLAAYAAGMGNFGPAGCMNTAEGFGGRFGSISTDGYYADDFEKRTADELETIYQELMKQYCYTKAGPELIAACPANAISAEGIDAKACQAYCKTINEFPPSPEVCGKCFFFL